MPTYHSVFCTDSQKSTYEKAHLKKKRKTEVTVKQGLAEIGIRHGVHTSTDLFSL